MPSQDPSRTPDELATSAKQTGQSLYSKIYDTMVTGVAIIIPVVITLYILQIGLNFIRSALEPFIQLLQWAGVIDGFQSVALVDALQQLGLYAVAVEFFTELVALVVLLVLIAIVGTIARNQYGEQMIGVFDYVVSSIPGLGSVYQSFRRMGDVVLDEGNEQFQDVKLVQCFDENVYVLGFQTGGSPATIENSTGHDEMVSMFLPLAPNPVTGGLLTYIPKDDVYDIDLTVEEGIRSILTSGVASEEGEGNTIGVDMDELRQSERFQEVRDAMITRKTDENE